MSKVFVDTNIFVYARIDVNDPKAVLAEDFLADLTDKPQISTQVLIEFVSVARKRRLSNAEISEELAFLNSAAVVALTDPPCISEAVEIMESARLSWFDALIVAAARRAGCDTLVTEGLSHGQTIGGVQIVNPFANLAQM